MHPHRGFETVTYMLEGAMRHEDSLGNKGVIGPGDVQWMTAGRGIVHSEMPEQKQGLLFGFQLWVNLPRTDKLVSPRYQNLKSEEIKEVTLNRGVKIRVVAGEVDGVKGPVTGIAVDPLYLDIGVPQHCLFHHPVPKLHTALAYVFEGQGEFGVTEMKNGTKVGSQELAVFSSGHHITVKTYNSPIRFLLLAGRPLQEPIARRGPFVMNRQEELEQAFHDYQNGSFT